MYGTLNLFATRKPSPDVRNSEPVCNSENHHLLEVKLKEISNGLDEEHFTDEPVTKATNKPSRYEGLSLTPVLRPDWSH
ncbi:hypothetical protein CSKR_200123 [Clonorchis sinensis]|uniref:Uncharacterized protein n=1 Tax=Clonorchis sinensis TaxID=79923 RepID=A0A8T1LZF3_CLOSI|nr:hypothetical protein CSKR_200123 [Clonorchis sinensis]